MNIISKPELAKQIRREYAYLIRSESHDYATAWLAIKLHISINEINEVIDTEEV